MPPVSRDPVGHPHFDGEAPGDGEDYPQRPAGPEGTMREQPVVAHGDTESGDQVHDGADDQVVPAQPPSPGQRDRGEQGKQGHDDEEREQDLLTEGLRLVRQVGAGRPPRPGGPGRERRPRRQGRGGAGPARRTPVVVTGPGCGNARRSGTEGARTEGGGTEGGRRGDGFGRTGRGSRTGNRTGRGGGRFYDNGLGAARCSGRGDDGRLQFGFTGHVFPSVSGGLSVLPVVGFPDRGVGATRQNRVGCTPASRRGKRTSRTPPTPGNRASRTAHPKAVGGVHQARSNDHDTHRPPSPDFRHRP